MPLVVVASTLVTAMMAITDYGVSTAGARVTVHRKCCHELYRQTYDRSPQNSRSNGPASVASGMTSTIGFHDL